MNFSETTNIKIDTDETPLKLSIWNFDIVILVYVCVLRELVNSDEWQRIMQFRIQLVLRDVRHLIKSFSLFFQVSD